MSKSQPDTGDPILGARLRELRIKADLSQEQLGDLLELSRFQIGKIETGARSTSIGVIRKWYEACGYQLDTIEIGASEDAVSLGQALAALSQQDVKAIITIALAWPRLSERTRGRILGLVDLPDP